MGVSSQRLHACARAFEPLPAVATHYPYQLLRQDAIAHQTALQQVLQLPLRFSQLFCRISGAKASRYCTSHTCVVRCRTATQTKKTNKKGRWLHGHTEFCEKSKIPSCNKRLVTARGRFHTGFIHPKPAQSQSQVATQFSGSEK